MRQPEESRLPGDVEPYRGLVPFGESDAPYFYGRDRVRQQISSNLRASRLTVLFGTSGVGKTSVLRAGVMPHLSRLALEAFAREDEADDGPTRNVPVYVGTWPPDPIAGVNAAVSAAIEVFVGRAPTPTGEEGLADTLRAWGSEFRCRFLVILDQFEECFFVYDQNVGQLAARELGRAVRESDVPASFLISIREDMYARLDRFKDELPNIFGNTLRVDHLTREDAREAITRPLDRYNELNPAATPVAIEHQLVEQVLSEASPATSFADEAGRAGTEARATSAERVQAPYLQLVMSRLWREERQGGSSVLRGETLERLGGSAKIWAGHLEEALSALTESDRDTVAKLFRQLVTPAGTKYPYAPTDLATQADVDPEDSRRLVEYLADRRRSILRPIEPAPGQTEPRYEIVHDLLGEAVLEWRRLHEQGRLAAEAEERLAAERGHARARVAATRRRALIGTGVTLGAVLLAVFAMSAAAADQNAKDARSRELAASSLQLAEADPVAAVEAALEARQISSTAEADGAVRLAVGHLPLHGWMEEPHEGAVWSIAFDEDGGQALTASADGTAKVVEVATGDVLAELVGHSGDVTGARFTPDGASIVTTGSDGTARVWDASNGVERLTLQHDAEVFLGSQPFAADGTVVLTVSGLEAVAWDLVSGERLATMEAEGEQVLDAAASADGVFVAISAVGGIARLWAIDDAMEGAEPLHVLDNEAAWTDVVAFSPDGTLLATGNADSYVLLWATETGELIRYDYVGYEPVTTVAFNPGGDLLLSVNRGERKAVVYEVPETESSEEEREDGFVLSAVLDPRASYIEGATWSPDGTSVLTWHQDGSARVFDVQTSNEVQAFKGHEGIVWRAAFSPDGGIAATASEDGLALFWQVEEGVALDVSLWPVLASAFSAAGDRVATAAVDERAAIWDSESGELLHELDGFDVAEFGYYPVASVEFTPDDAQILTAQRSEAGTVAVWDATTGGLHRSCCKDPDGWPAVAATHIPDGSGRITVFYRDNSLSVWSLGEDEELWSTGDTAALDDDIVGAAIDPNGDRMVLAGRDGFATLLDLATLDEIGAWEIDLVSSLDFSGLDSLVSAGFDGQIRVWNLRDWDDDGEPPPVTAVISGVQPGTVITANDDDDRPWIVGGTPDGRTSVWDLSSGSLLGEASAHGGAINSVSVADDGRILTASDDGTARVYECSTCGPMDELVERARAIVRGLRGDSGSD